MFINPIRKENEIQYFQETMRKLKNERKEVWDGFLDDLSEKNREKLNEIMSLRKIEDNEGGREHKYRKIIRIKGKKNAKTVNFENQEMEYKNSLYFDLNQDFWVKFIGNLRNLLFKRKLKQTKKNHYFFLFLN